MFAGSGIIPVEIRVQHHFRHAIFIGIRDFEPFGVEKLDPVVAEWVMRRGDDHTDIRPHVGREKGNRRSGQGADKKDIHPRRQQARRQRVLEHISRKAGILTDDYAAASVLVPIERASGKPRRKATSGVIGYLLTRPLIPSVPKRRTLINYSKISFVIKQRNRPLIRSDAGKSTRFPG